MRSHPHARKILIPVISTLFLLFDTTAWGETAKKIDVENAEKLVRKAVDKSMSDDTFDYDRRQDSPFITFQAFGGGEAGSNGYFSVNPWTGDVWALWGCKTLSTPALRKAQAEDPPPLHGRGTQAV